MKKLKVISLTLVIMIVLSTIFSVTTFASSQGVYDNFKYSILDDGTAQIIGYTGNDTDISIPSKVNGCTVSAIGSKAFFGYIKIKSVAISNTVKSIGCCAFDCCTNLLNADIPNSVENIGEGAFFSCTRLKKINIPSSVKSIGNGAFYDCKNLENIVVPDSVTNLDSYVFGKCIALKSAVIGKRVKSLCNQIFTQCTNLASVTIKGELESIGSYAFLNCNQLSKINIPDSVSKIGTYAFSSCSSIYNINIPKSLLSIEDCAFDYCNLNTFTITPNVEKISDEAFCNFCIEHLKSDNEKYVVKDNVLFSQDMKKLVYCAIKSDDEDGFSYKVPNSVTEIAPYAFSEESISGITFSENLKTIGGHAFCNTQIGKVNIPSYVTQIGDYAFSGCFNITNVTIPGNVSKISDYSFYECNQLSSFTISEGVKSIGKYICSNYSGIKSINIPASVNSVSPFAFSGLNDLCNINVSPDNSNYTSVDGVMFNKNKTELVTCPCSKKTNEYKIPNGTEKLGDYAMINTKASKIAVPDSVTEIGKYSMGYINANSKYDRIDNFMIIASQSSSTAKYADENDVACFTSEPKMNAAGTSLKAGETFNLSIKNADNKRISYSSSDQNVAVVDQNGKITAVSKGSTYVIASCGTKYFNFSVNVLSGNIKSLITINEGFNTSPYKTITNSDYKKFSNDYYKYNKNISTDILDNTSIYSYTSDEYIPIMAYQIGGTYKQQAEENYGKDYQQFKTVSENLFMELNRFKQNSNITLFSGTNNVSNITGTTSSVKDMIASIGKIYDEKNVISTSVDRGVSKRFGTGSYHTVLEFYASANGIKGAFLEKITCNGGEYELLLNKDNKFKIIDAGVRKAKFSAYDGHKFDTNERFIKLAFVNSDLPQTTSATAGTSKKSDSGSIPTGIDENRLLFSLIASMSVCAAICVCLYLRKKEEH